jgi:endonuclease/exonuclease/phosphatase family metal-dependent hydrolase
MDNLAMKLITLNIWGGHVRSPLLEFIKSHQDIDIFCFQEMYRNAPKKISDEDRKLSLNIFTEFQDLLPAHSGYFRPVIDEVYGIGMFIRKGIKILGEGEIKIHLNPDYPGYGPTHPRNLQWAKCIISDVPYTIINVHGLWNGRGKTDTPERIAQSQRIREFMDMLDEPKILCGDLNLRPDTESLKILERGMKNLIQSHNVSSTRTSYYPKPEKFADYIFTSPEINVKRFEVMKDEVSDHAPLLLDFE